MTNRPNLSLSNLSLSGRFSAVFFGEVVGPAGLQKACVFTPTLICPTGSKAHKECRGVPSALSNHLTPARLASSEGLNMNLNGGHMPTVLNSRMPRVRQDGHLTRHELAIRMLVNGDPEIHRNGFKKAVRDLWLELDPEAETGEVPKMYFLPDAYRIDREACDLIIYEVEDSNPISPDKLRSYAHFWADWDSEGAHDWLPRLVVVDRYGEVASQPNLMKLYHAFLDEGRP